MSSVQEGFTNSVGGKQETQTSNKFNTISHDDFAVRSFRIPRSDFDRLQEEARERDVSVSLIVEEAIRRHVEYDQVVKKFKVMHLGSSQLKLFLDAISEDAIVEIAQSLASDPLMQDWPFMLKASEGNSAKGILNAMKFLAKYDTFDVSEFDYGTRKIVFFAHEAGRHWSLFVATLWKTIFELAGIAIKARADDRAAIFEFEKSQLV